MTLKGKGKWWSQTLTLPPPPPPVQPTLQVDTCIPVAPSRSESTASHYSAERKASVAVPTLGRRLVPATAPPGPLCKASPHPPTPTHTPAARLLPGYHQSASRAALAESGRQPLSARARGGASPAPSQDARRPAAGEVGAARGAQEARGAGEERAPASAPPPSGGAGAVAPAEDRRGQGRDREEGHRGKRER